MLFCLFHCTCVCAQKSTPTIITGTVIDATTQEPLPYVYLKLDNYALGTVTEADGSYRIDIPTRLDEGAVTFSYLGYQSRTIPVRALRKLKTPVVLKTSATTLAEVTVTPKKLPSARVILRRAIRNIPLNYPQGFHLQEGYYRETLKENGVYIKLADAAVRHRSAPYQKGDYRNKDLANPNDWGTTLSGGTWLYAGASLHRIHFHHQSLKTDQLQVVDARASENGTRRKMKANIQGGPLSLFARDRVKFQQSFLGEKRLRDFDYLVDEVQDENGKWCYALHFRTTTTKKELDKLGLRKTTNKQWKVANKHKLLEGTLLIDQDDYAILAYDCHVPNELKPFFCGYTTMATKHFDYKLNARYVKENGRYVLDYLRHEDEFIFKDTTDQTTTPYAAVSEYTRLEAVQPAPTSIPIADHFANTNSNELYEYPLAYDSAFWAQYLARYPEVTIGEAIRADMETTKTLEQQFRDQQRRDESLPPPVAPVDPVVTTIHGEKLTDDYAWLKDTKNPRANRPVMDYLYAENEYTDNYYRPIRKLQREVFTRLKWDMEKEYTSLPTKDNGYYYFFTYAEDQEYPVYFRAPVADSTRKDTLFDVNKAAEDYDTYSLGGISVAPNNQLMAYAENTTGSDRYVVRFRSLDGTNSPTDSLHGVSGLVWIDSETFLYSSQDPKTLRTDHVLRHRMGTRQESDEIIFEEQDPLFSLSVYKAKSKAFIYVSSSSSDANEIHYLRTDQPK
ncbi:MAG: carboxypeptidase-like regulatory domain-containing protein, partial [Bacteroidota bacterium]